MACEERGLERWRAVAVYRSKTGPVDVEWFFEEIEDLHELIERGPHWDTIMRCTIYPNRPAEDVSGLTLEEAETL